MIEAFTGLGLLCIFGIGYYVAKIRSKLSANCESDKLEIPSKLTLRDMTSAIARVLGTDYVYRHGDIDIEGNGRIRFRNAKKYIMHDGEFHNQVSMENQELILTLLFSLFEQAKIVKDLEEKNEKDNFNRDISKGILK